MTQAVMLQGTASDVGKSVLAAGLCRIFYQDGLRTAPFKSQNMALNSGITPDGKEMGRAQIFQAEAAGITPDVRMNPVLLKPTSDRQAQVVLMGKVATNMDAVSYHDYKPRLREQILAVYNSLAQEYDVIVLEGSRKPGGNQSARSRYRQYGNGGNGPVSGYSGGGYRPGRRIRRYLWHAGAAA